ncbi:MAG: ATP-binding protein [Streptosporangiaceae bacterium]
MTPEAHPRRYSRAFHSHPSVAGECRRILRGALIEWGLPHLYDDASLVLTEMLTNAIRSGDLIRVEVFTDGDRVVLEVFDPSTELPKRGDPEPEDEGGRGVSIIDAYADTWGYRLVKGGKVVFAVLIGE